MKAIILAAGVGKRLAAAFDGKPKCLLEFGNLTLLQRHIDLLVYYGINEITIVTGYQSNLIEVAVRSVPIKINILYNPRFEEGSVISFWTARDIMTDPEDVLLMDADVLYDHHILSRLIHSGHANCFLLDREFEPGEEPVKICIKNDRIVEFRKQIPTDLDFDLQGESVGFFKFNQTTGIRLMEYARQYLDNQQFEAPYEDVIRDVTLQAPERFAYEDITGIPWTEIDFPQDLDKANNVILPRLSRLEGKEK